MDPYHTHVPGKGRWWGHVRIQSHDLSSVELLCEWICGPENPDPRVREEEEDDKYIICQGSEKHESTVDILKYMLHVQDYSILCLGPAYTHTHARTKMDEEFYEESIIGTQCTLVPTLPCVGCLQADL